MLRCMGDFGLRIGLEARSPSALTRGSVGGVSGDENELPRKDAMAGSEGIFWTWRGNLRLRGDSSPASSSGALADAEWPC